MICSAAGTVTRSRALDPHLLGISRTLLFIDRVCHVCGSGVPRMEYPAPTPEPQIPSSHLITCNATIPADITVLLLVLVVVVAVAGGGNGPLEGKGSGARSGRYVAVLATRGETRLVTVDSIPIHQ